MASNAENVSIWWRHHALYILQVDHGNFMSRILSADWQKASQSMAIIGLIALVAAAVVSLLTLCCKNCGRRLILILQTVVLFGSGRYIWAHRKWYYQRTTCKTRADSAFSERGGESLLAAKDESPDMELHVWPDSIHINDNYDNWSFSLSNCNCFVILKRVGCAVLLSGRVPYSVHMGTLLWTDLAKSALRLSPGHDITSS